MTTQAQHSDPPDTSGGKKALLALFLVVFIDLFGFGMILPLLPQIADTFASPANAEKLFGPLNHVPVFLKTLLYSFMASEGPVTGWLLSLFSLMNFLFSPFWGSWSDRIGRKPILIFGLIGNVVGNVLFALSFSWGIYALMGMYFARIVSGISGANIAVANAYIADHTTPENRTKAMGLIGAAFGLGFILGPAIGGLMAGAWGWASPFWFAAGFSLISAVLAFSVLKDADASVRQQGAGSKKKRIELLKTAWKKNHLKGALILFFLSTFGFANLELSFVLFCKKELFLKENAVGFLFLFAGVVIAFTQGFAIRKLAVRFNETTLIKVGQFLTAVGLFLVPFSLLGKDSHLLGIPMWLPIILFAIFLLAFGNGINNPALTSYISLHTPDEIQGGLMGVAQSLGSLGRVLGPIFAGWIYSHYGPHTSFYTGAGIMMLGTLLAIVSMKAIDYLKDRKPEVS